MCLSLDVSEQTKRKRGGKLFHPHFSPKLFTMLGTVPCWRSRIEPFQPRERAILSNANADAAGLPTNARKHAKTDRAAQHTRQDGKSLKEISSPDSTDCEVGIVRCIALGCNPVLPPPLPKNLQHDCKCSIPAWEVLPALNTAPGRPCVLYWTLMELSENVAKPPKHSSRSYSGGYTSGRCNIP